MPRPKLQLSPSTPRALMNYLLMMPLLMTLMVTERLLLLKAKSKLKERRHVHLMGTGQLKRGMKKPLLFNNSFYCYFFTLCIITFCLCGKTVFIRSVTSVFGCLWTICLSQAIYLLLLVSSIYIYTNLDILMLLLVSWEGVLSRICLFCWSILQSFLGVLSHT